jgi:hypothetical protein
MGWLVALRCPHKPEECVMPDYIGGQSTGEKVLMYIAMAMLIPLFIALSQPAWRGEEMIKEKKANCDKVGGVMIVTNGILANTYRCSPRLDRGKQDE